MTLEEIRGAISKFIRERSGRSEIDESVNLFEEGILDSFDMVSVAEFLESTFAVTIEDVLFFDEAFGTLAGMSEAILRLREAG